MIRRPPDRLLYPKIKAVETKLFWFKYALEVARIKLQFFVHCRVNNYFIIWLVFETYSVARLRTEMFWNMFVRSTTSQNVGRRGKKSLQYILSWPDDMKRRRRYAVYLVVNVTIVTLLFNDCRCQVFKLRLQVRWGWHSTFWLLSLSSNSGFVKRTKCPVLQFELTTFGDAVVS